MPVRSNLLFILPAVFALGACSSTDAPSDTTAASTDMPSMDGRCNTASAQTYIGKPISQALVEQAQRSAGAGTVRVLQPGDAMTMDYDSTRLTLDTDANGVIRQASCG
jgi:hypothetical protein